MSNNSVVHKGSISDIANQENISLAESFLNAEMIVLADTSYSMWDRDVPELSNRYDLLCFHLRHLQADNQGKIALVSFSGQNQVMYCPSGNPHPFKGGTDLTGALKFIKIADDCGLKIVVISDGEPDNGYLALDVAETFTNRIDVIYCGHEGGRGQQFLSKLARATGGKFASSHTDVGKEVQFLLSG